MRKESQSRRQRAAVLLALFALVVARPISIRGQAFTLRSSPPRTYSASFSVACGGAGDCVVLSLAAAGVTEVREIWVATPSSAVTVSIIRRSSADSGGTSTTETAGKHNTANASPNTVVTAYTVAPTAGAAVATLFSLPVTTTEVLVRDYTAPNEQPIILQSTSEFLAISVSGAATIGVNLVWTESP